MSRDEFDCQMLVELVTEWLEGALDEPARNELELHVSTCSGCVAYIEQIRATNAALTRLDSVETVEAVGDTRRDELLAIFRARRAG